MSKRKKKHALKISPATTLRPRLDALWAGDALLHQDDAAIQADLDAIARDVAADFLVVTITRRRRVAGNLPPLRLSASAALR